MSWYLHFLKRTTHNLVFHKVGWFEKWHSTCYFGLNLEEDIEWMDSK